MLSDPLSETIVETQKRRRAAGFRPGIRVTASQ